LELCFVLTKIARIFAESKDANTQIIPATIPGCGDIYIVNPLSSMDCIDYNSSQIEYYPDNFEDNSRRGLPRMIIDLSLRFSGTIDASIFRIKGWPIPLFVTEPLAATLLHANPSGLALEEIQAVIEIYK